MKMNDREAEQARLMFIFSCFVQKLCLSEIAEANSRNNTDIPIGYH